MGRRPLAVGQTGRVTAKLDPDAEVWVARCRIRDGDGKLRQVQAQGKTSAAATKALKAAIKTRGVRSGGFVIHSHMFLHDLAEFVFTDLAQRAEIEQRSPKTVSRYRQAWRNHIEPQLGSLRLFEITTFMCDDLLLRVRAKYGASNTQTVRVVFNRIMGYADKGPESALPNGNPMRKASRIPGEGGKKDVKTLPAAQVGDLLSKLRDDDVARERELEFYVLWMVCTGDRIGNCLAVDWSYLDLVEGFANLRGVAIYDNEKSEMTINFNSSKGKEREIDLPSQLIVAMRHLWIQRGSPPSGLVFPGRRGRPRNLNTIHRHCREAFDAAGYKWLEPHGFRKTTATELSVAGLSDHEIASYLGHDNVETTRRHYLAKRQESERRRTALDALVGGPHPRATVTPLHGRTEGDLVQSAE